MKRLNRDRFTTVLDPKLPPTITIRSGEELVVETWDAYKGVWDAGEEPRVLAPATGPIAVEDANPGDVLKVDVLAIQRTTAAARYKGPSETSTRLPNTLASPRIGSKRLVGCCWGSRPHDPSFSCEKAGAMPGRCRTTRSPSVQGCEA